MSSSREHNCSGRAWAWCLSTIPAMVCRAPAQSGE
jgi:hypothetical protein